jgi:hypothetical protein
MSKSFLPLLLGSASWIMLSGVALAQTPNVDGNWTIKLAGQNRSATLTLVQKGNALTGTFNGERGKLPVTGTVTDDNKVTFSGKSFVGSLRFAGTVEGKTMKGTVDLPLGRGRQNWTATH